MERSGILRIGLIPLLLLMLVIIVGCQQSNVDQSSSEAEAGESGPTTTESSRGGTISQGDTKADDRAGAEKSEKAGAGANGKAQAEGKKDKPKKDKANIPPGKVKLKIGGEPGTRFAGTCTIGGDEREFSGRVPESFVYKPGDRDLQCDIRSTPEDAGPLKFSVKAGSENQQQRIKATAENIDFTLSGGSVSYSSSSTSSSSSSSVVQKSSVSSSSYSSSSSSSSSGSP